MEKGVIENSFVFTLVSEEFVFKELTKLNPYKSTGLDNISAKFLKDGASIVKCPLTHIVNLSLSSHIVPKEFKQARVKPLFKKNNRSDVGNYRPVSILNICSKILEKAVYFQVEKYLTDNNLLYNLQSGFRGKHSTDTCLTNLTDCIRQEISRGNFTGMILIDLQKAFDTVDHNILCNKLKHMGFEPINWFKSYLTDREQTVNVNNIDSDFLSITCGVPQGSILGPLLFLCYVNDMPISVKCKLLLYADDSALIVSGKDPKVISETLSKELESCRQWLIDNKLSLHLGKTESILFGSKRKLRKVNDFNVTCNGKNIDRSSSVKYLGLPLDQCLSGVSIVQNILSKSNSRLKFLYRQAKVLSSDSRKTLCSALIQPHFDYACSAWFSALPKNHKNKLQIIQNKMVRFILNKDARSHIGQEELHSVKLLNVPDRVKQLKLNHVYNIFNGTSPSYLSQNFTRVSDQHQYNTRQSSLNFIVPNVSGQAKQTFFYTSINVWNSLPSCTKNCSSRNSFKRHIKDFLVNQSIDRENNDFVFY